MTAKPMTIQKVYHLLTQNEKARACFLLRAWAVNSCSGFEEERLRYSNVGPALLPFVPIDTVRTAVYSMAEFRSDLQLSAKLKELTPAPPQFHRVLRLDGAKVAKTFGAHPERGRTFKWLPALARTAGWKSKPFGRGLERAPVTVWPVIALKHIHGKRWELICNDEYRSVVENWIIDNLM